MGVAVNFVDELRLGTQVRKYAKQPEGAFVTKSGFEKLVTLTLKEFVTDSNKKQYAASITDRLFSLYDMYATSTACVRVACRVPDQAGPSVPASRVAGFQTIRE